MSSPEVNALELIHFGDVIDVDMAGGFEFDWRGTLDPEGNLDGIDGFSESIPALCRDVRAVAANIERVFGKILREPKATVRIVDRSNRAVARLIGAVRTPTRFRLNRPATLREMITLAGGLTDEASGEIQVLRSPRASCAPPDTGPESNGSYTLTIKVSDLLKGGALSDIGVVSGDLITVSRSKPVYVIGAVNSPRPLYLHGELTLTRAIAMAGGLAKDADKRSVTLFRRSEAGQTVEIFDLNKLKAGLIKDAVLQSFDIIDVTSKGGEPRKLAPATENAVETVPSELPLRIID